MSAGIEGVTASQWCASRNPGGLNDFSRQEARHLLTESFSNLNLIFAFKDVSQQKKVIFQRKGGALWKI